MDSINIVANRAGPPSATPPNVVADRARGEAIGQATLRGLAALLFGVLAAATWPVESSADLVAAEPADPGWEDDQPGLNSAGMCVAADSGDGTRV